MDMIETLLSVGKDVIYDKKQFEQFEKVVLSIENMPTETRQPLIDLLKTYIHMSEELGYWLDVLKVGKRGSWSVNNKLAHGVLYKIQNPKTSC